MKQNGEVQGEFTVRRELGMHARPSGQFAAIASSFQSEIRVARQGSDEWVNAKSVLSLLSMAATQGTVLVIRASGPDAQEALDALGALVEQLLEVTA